MKKYIRIQNPDNFNSKEIFGEIDLGNEVVIQFSDVVYDSKKLERIDELCRACSEDLCVRFYSHYPQGFDCSVLKYLPNVKNLYLDCLHTVTNFSELKKLQYLRKLNIGIFELDDKEFLSWDNLKKISHLCLGETRKNNFNLKYLSEYSEIETLFLNGHTKNIESIGALSKLSKLSLCVPSKASIEFINQNHNLTKLTLILGGRSNLEEIHNGSLEELEIIRVRGFSNLGNIGDFPKLRKLLIEDQIQLEEINFTKRMPSLSDFRILNCKSLHRIGGIQYLSALQHLRIYKTALDFDDFMENAFPKSLDILAFYTTKSKVDKEIRARLNSMGYSDGIAG